MEGKEGVLEAKTGYHWVKRRVWELPSCISSHVPHIQHRADGRHQMFIKWSQSWDERFQILYGLLGKQLLPPLDTHLRVAGFPSNWAGGEIIEDFINGFIGSGQEAGSSLRKLRSEIRDPRGLWKRIPPPTKFWACPQAAGYFQVSWSQPSPGMGTGV